MADQNDLKEKMVGIELEISHLKRDRRECKKEISELRSMQKVQREEYMALFKVLTQEITLLSGNLTKFTKVISHVKWWLLGALMVGGLLLNTSAEQWIKTLLTITALRN